MVIVPGAVFGRGQPTSNIERCLAPELAPDLDPNYYDPRREVTMRNLLKFILFIGVIGSLAFHLRATGPSRGTQSDARNNTDTLTKADRLAPPSLGVPVPQPRAQKKIDYDAQEVDSEQAALVNVMKAAIAARHGGVVPKTPSGEDAKAASQAAMRWQMMQAAERTKREQSSSGRHN
jgi:hypothetical protein